MATAAGVFTGFLGVKKIAEFADRIADWKFPRRGWRMKITADQLDRATGCGGATASVWVEHINGAMAVRDQHPSVLRCFSPRSGTKARASSAWWRI